MPVEWHGDAGRPVFFLHAVSSLVLERQLVASGASPTPEHKESMTIYHVL
jgi:hypothetical protein